MIPNDSKKSAQLHFQFHGERIFRILKSFPVVSFSLVVSIMSASNIVQ